MRLFHKHLQKLKLLERKKHHPLVHQLHKKYGISKKTLFYMKEYGPHANIPRTIIRESLGILLLASVISSFGGLSLEYIKSTLVSIIPLIILLPVLNGMIGNYGIIMSSKFSTMLHEGKIKGRWWVVSSIRKLFMQIFVLSIITGLISAIAALAISSISGHPFTSILASKVMFVVMLDVILLIGILMLVSTSAGVYFFSKEEDPNNFLIPITTSITDLGNMVLLSVLIVLIF